MVSNYVKSKINRLYFVENMTISDISKELKVKYDVVLRNVKRGDIYKLNRHKKRNLAKSGLVTEISKVVADYYELKDGIINKKTTIKEIVIPRQVAHLISYNLTSASNAVIGQLIGSVNPATVIHSRKTILGFLEYDTKLRKSYSEMEALCKSKIKEHESAS